jgi:putative esterase
MKTILLAACLLVQESAVEVTVAEPVTDADGVIRHRVTSTAQSKPVDVRILAPAKLPPGDERRFLFVLPVEPEGSSRWGDGLAEVRRLGLHEKYGLVVVAPGFAQLPWYADHPTESKRRDESHLLKAVIPLVDRLYPSKKPCRLLLGFSKSGWGAFNLILRHPDLFRAAAAWDAPLMKEKPDQFEMGPAFATQENFERHQVTRLLREKAETFRAAKRLAHFGYGSFRDHHQRAQALLEELKIPVDYQDGPARKHAWESGWVADAVAALDAMGR